VQKQPHKSTVFPALICIQSGPGFHFMAAMFLFLLQVH